MQLGGHWVGPVNPDELPYRYQIDYVRFYKKKAAKTTPIQ
jgi:hypothetical protein